MFEFLRRLFHPCKHKWKCMHVLEDIYYNEEWDEYPAETIVTKIYKCEKCGKVKEESFIVN